MPIQRKLTRPYRKRYLPINWDKYDPKVITGQAIEPGTIVTVTHHVGPFRWITDEHGNEQSVMATSLDPVKEKL